MRRVGKKGFREQGPEIAVEKAVKPDVGPKRSAPKNEEHQKPFSGKPRMIIRNRVL